MADLKQFKNLVFEGGGVKGIAYCGALEVLEEKGILPNIQRVAGTSAGAITAGLLAVGYNNQEIFTLLEQTNFKSFMDSHWGIFRDIFSLIKRFGWYQGKAFQRWFEERLHHKTGNRHFTFRHLEEARSNQKDSFRSLAVTGTNLNNRSTEIFSFETTPDLPIARAVRISMSIPLFFRAVNYRGNRYVDGGLYYNYPLNIFDNEKYLEEPRFGLPAPYDTREGAVFNCQTLGFRVDSKKERHALMGEAPPEPIRNFKDYMGALIGGYMDGMNKIHLHKNDWHRTVFIDSLGVSTTQFDLDRATIDRLVASGREGCQAYFDWFENPGPDDEQPVNKVG